MISFQHNERSGIAELLDMVWRNAPRLMREGGGPLAEEKESTHHPRRITDQQRETLLELARTGKHTATEIAEFVGVTSMTVRNHCKRRLIALPDGRLIENRRRVAA